MRVTEQEHPGFMFSGSVQFLKGLPWWLRGKEFTCNAGDTDSTPELGRYPEEENGNPLQNSCLGNPMDRGAWQTTVRGVAKELDMTERLKNFLKSALFLILPSKDTKSSTITTFHKRGQIHHIIFFSFPHDLVRTLSQMSFQCTEEN